MQEASGLFHNPTPMGATTVANDVTNTGTYLRRPKTPVRKCHPSVLDLTIIAIVLPHTIIRLIIRHLSGPARKLDSDIPTEHTFIPNNRTLYLAIPILRLRRQYHLNLKPTLQPGPCHQEMCHRPEAYHLIPLMLPYPKHTLDLSTLVLVDLVWIPANLDFTLLYFSRTYTLYHNPYPIDLLF